MRTMILSGIENHNNVLTARIPVEGLGELFGAVQNLENAKANGLPTAPAKAVLNKVITNTSNALIKQGCGTNCAPPVRKITGIKVTLDQQIAPTKGESGKQPPIQIRAYNAVEKNAMTRVAIEPIKQMMEANLQVCLRNPAQLEPIYHVDVYTQYLREALAAWDNPVELAAVQLKYKGRYHKYNLTTSGQLNGLGSMLDDAWDGAGDMIRGAAGTVGKLADDAFTSIKGVVTKVADVIGDIGRAIGEGLKNAATWVVGMLQKFNPIMIAARSAFRGLVAVNFRGLGSDMQGMRDRGEENKIKDIWTSVWIGGNWGDLVASINAGAGRDKKLPEATTAEPALETVDAPPPFPIKILPSPFTPVSAEAKAAADAKYAADVVAYNRTWRPELLENAPAPVLYKVPEGPSGMSQDKIDIFIANYRNNVYQPALDAYNIKWRKSKEQIESEGLKAKQDLAAKNAPLRPQVSSTITVGNVTIKKFIGATPAQAQTLLPTMPAFMPAQGFMQTPANMQLFRGFGNLGEPVSLASMLGVSTPVYATIVNVIGGIVVTGATTYVTAKVNEVKTDPVKAYNDISADVNKASADVDKAKKDAQALIDQGKAIIDIGKGIINPQNGGTLPYIPPTPVTPPNGGTDVPAKSNTMLYVGIAAAFVLVLGFTFMSNAKNKGTVSGLGTAKVPVKTIKNFKL